jgi:hypothetical protein
MPGNHNYITLKRLFNDLRKFIKIMEFDLIIRLPAVAQTIAVAIEHGREWGQRFLNDSSWRGNKKKMAKYAIGESARWATWKGIMGVTGIPSQVAVAIYSQIKLAATLFTIYDIDTTRHSTQALVLAAVAGVSVPELANYLPANTAQPGIKKALMSISGKNFTEIHKNLGIKLLASIGNKCQVNTSHMHDVGAVMLYHQPSTITNQVSGVSMDACGHSVINFIDTWKQA